MTIAVRMDSQLSNFILPPNKEVAQKEVSKEEEESVYDVNKFRTQLILTGLITIIIPRSNSSFIGMKETALFSSSSSITLNNQLLWTLLSSY